MERFRVQWRAGAASAVECEVDAGFLKGGANDFLLEVLKAHFSSRDGDVLTVEKEETCIQGAFVRPIGEDLLENPGVVGIEVPSQ